MDKMTAKQLLSDHSESQTFGAESSGLGTAALAKKGAVAARIGSGSDASDSDDDGLRSRPVKKRAAGTDRACRALVPARPAGGRWQRHLGLRVAEHQGIFEVHSSKDSRQG